VNCPAHVKAAALHEAVPAQVATVPQVIIGTHDMLPSQVVKPGQVC
jgi:hypothetical protein